MAERLGTYQPAWSGTSVNPYATVRATVDRTTAAFMTMVAATRAELHPPGGTQLVEEAASYWKVVQYPESTYPCTPANMKRISFREELWLAAQQNLAQLVAATSMPPFTGTLPAMSTAERKYVAALFADWYVVVMSWVSLAAYSTNIQPGFLCPDSAVGPQLKPTRTPGIGLPSGLDTLRQEIKGFMSGSTRVGDEYAAKYLDKDEWGPMWMGYYDRGEATGWLVGDFNPQTDPKAHELKYGNGGVDYIYPATLQPGSCPDSKTTMRSRITDPWYQCFYTLLHWDFGPSLVKWRQHDTTGVNETFTRWMLGPNSLRRVALAWALWVCNRTMMDVIMQSATWYATNYIGYWQSKGLADLPPSVAARLSREQAGEAMRVRQAAANQAIDTINSTAVSLTVALAPVPWAGAVAAGAALLIKGITRLIMKRRRKKQKPVPVMQPLMLRSLSDPACDFFPPGALIQESLVKFLTEVKANEVALARAPEGVVPPLGTAGDDPLALGSPIATATGTAPPELSVSPDAPRLVQIAPVSGTSAINTSTSGALRPGTPLPTVRDISAAEVQVQRTPPTTSGTAKPPGEVPWALIGLGGLAAVAVFQLTRRR